VNVVGRNARELEDYFYSAAARVPDNLGRFRTEAAPSGVPLLADAMVAFDCAVQAEHPAGDHTLFVASIRSVRVGSRDVPLTSLDLEYVYLGTGRIVRR
jgi:flavin reductase (DIM6/NTAB) family NADH-FMN oxidoreductase RutF